ncbi:uncharacterized protein RJT21DRAFT_116169 [Scheffersomyces amazonensis]|uniref:uncharacterized protein n=1 Tax=Scheffersomyces amazonensis TaxID=1078765 RepID=UPI00315D14EE
MSISDTLHSEGSQASSKSLTQQLDDIANEASFYTPLETPTEQRSTYSQDESLTYSPFNTVNSTGDTTAQCIPGVFRKFVPGKTSRADAGETSPLLPISRRDCLPYNYNDNDSGTDNRSGTPPPPQTPPGNILIPVLQYIWINIFPESVRQFLIAHRIWVFLGGSLILIMVALALYFTGNLTILVVYLRMIICYIFGGVSSIPNFCKP